MSENDRIFYVYEHIRPDTGLCFYVGKGCRGRANNMQWRNRHHKNIQAKLASLGMCVEVRMVADCLTEDEAFTIEIDHIAWWRAKSVKLANVSSGGDGASGAPAWNKKSVTCLSDGRIFDSERAVAKFYRISESCVHQVCDPNSDRFKARGLIFVWGRVSLSKNDASELIEKITAERISNRKRRKGALSHNGDASNGFDVLGRKATGPMKNARPIECIDDGNKFPSVSAAARFYDIERTAIFHMCNGTGKSKRKTAGGLRFRHVENL